MLQLVLSLLFKKLLSGDGERLGSWHQIARADLAAELTFSQSGERGTQQKRFSSVDNIFSFPGFKTPNQKEKQNIMYCYLKVK